MRILTIISGIFMVLAGVFCFINPGQTFLSLAFVIGIVLVLNGVIHTLAYLVGRGFHNRGDNNGWILTDALITLLLGVLVLCNQLVAETSVHMVFGMWVLVSGILRIESSTHINRAKKPINFKVVLITGIFTILVGIVGFIDPLMGILSTTILVGMFMTMQGINILELGINMPHEKKSYVKIYKRKREPVKITEEDESPEKIAERLRMKQAAEEAAIAAGVNTDGTTL